SVSDGFLDVRQQGRRHVRSVRLPGGSGSVKVARDEVADALRLMGWTDHSVDRARVVASELVTNAVLHAGTAFELTIRIDGGAPGDGRGHARIEVSDGAPD